MPQTRLEIGGTVSEATALALAGAIRAEGLGTDWVGAQISDLSEAAEAMINADLEASHSLQLFKPGGPVDLAYVEAALVRLEVPFARWMDPDNGVVVWWRPGMEAPRTAPCDGEGEVYVSLSDLENALAGGGPVRLVEDLKIAKQVPPFVLEPAARAALELVAEGEEPPAPAPLPLAGVVVRRPRLG